MAHCAGVWRGTHILLGCLPVLLHAQQTVLPSGSVPRRASLTAYFANAASEALLVRAPDERRAGLISPVQTEFRMRIDSAQGAVLFARAPLTFALAPTTALGVAIPLVQGAMTLPRLTVQRLPERGVMAFGRPAPVLPRAQQERLATHATMRQLIELGALFESAPANGAADRRTTHYLDGDGDIRLAVDAERASRLLRDTVVNGRRAHIVHDSTALRVTHAYLAPSRFTATVSRTREVLQGAIVGVRFVDAESGLAFSMTDTLLLRGTIDVNDGLGGMVHGPLFLRSVRQSALRDSLSQSRVRQEPFDLVHYSTSLREPITPTRNDSLLDRLSAAPSISTRDSIRALVMLQNDTALWSRVAQRSLAVGDTASVVAWLARHASYHRHAVTVAEYGLMRRLLADAGAAYRTGTDRELLVVNLLDGLLSGPPVVARAGDGLACTSGACRAMVADAGNRSNVLLQAVGLVAGMVTAPRVWTDSVIRYAATNPLLAGRALWFARGASSTAVASAKAPIPEPDAPFARWVYWLVGEDSAYVRAVNADTAMRRFASSRNVGRPLTVSNEAAMAIRVATARTGLDYADAFRRERTAATSDSVRALYNALLIAMDESAYSTEELVRIMLSPGSPERDAAKAQIARANRGVLPLANDSVAATIGRLVVNMIFADSAVTLPRTDPRFSSWYTVPKTDDTLPRYIVMDSLPSSVRARAAELGFAPVATGWRLTPGAAAYEIRIAPIQRQGPFVRVSVTHTTLYSRGPGRSGGYAGGFMLLLVQGPAGWTVVDADAWVT